MDKKGFTLAEVLITLGIIGVVAALTLPTLISNYRKQEVVARLKKFYSILSQAIILSENDNGPSKEWTKVYYGGLEDASNKTLALNYFNNYLKAYIKYTQIDENPPAINSASTINRNIRIYLSDGSYFYMKNGACMDIDYDVNGSKAPNAYGADIFKFIICPEEKYKNECGSDKNFCPYCPIANCDTREKALQKCKTSPAMCAKILMMDGWEFKKDYPHKL